MVHKSDRPARALAKLRLATERYLASGTPIARQWLIAWGIAATTFAATDSATRAARIRRGIARLRSGGAS